MKPAKTMLIDLSPLNGRRQFPERYANDVQRVYGWPNLGDINQFLDGLDVVFTCETAYNFEMWRIARQRNIRTVQQHNYEFLDFVGPTRKDWPQPDLFASPTPWMHDELPFPNKMILPVPIDRLRLPYKKRTDPSQFLHIAGIPAVHDRNGTETVLDAVKYITHPNFKLYVRSQSYEHVIEWRKRLEPGETRVEFLTDEPDNYWEIYDKGSILLMPRRFGGLCLPVQEALSVGMPVIMTKISPNTELLPERWLLPVTKIGEFTPRATISIYEAAPTVLADTIDKIITEGMNRMMFDSLLAGNIAKELDWRLWTVRYNHVFEKLCAAKQ